MCTYFNCILSVVLRSSETSLRNRILPMHVLLLKILFYVFRRIRIYAAVYDVFSECTLSRIQAA